MRRLLVVLVTSLVLGLAGGVGTALAGTPGQPGLPLQSATQSNQGTNTANQSGISAPVVVSGPNIAVANGGLAGKSSCSPCGGSGGTVEQNSGNTVDASVVNKAKQANNQSSDLGQSQTVVKDSKVCCREDGKGSSASQSAEQSNKGTNKADQFGLSAPIVVSGPNIAALNKGDVNQNSGNSVDASVRNKARQTNDQSNDLDQHQKVVGRGGNCCSKDGGSGATQTAKQSNEGTNTAYQSGISAPIVVSGPNVAIANGWGHNKCNPCGDDRGTVNQNSGNSVDASVRNKARQTNDQCNDLDQNQKVVGRGGRGATQTAEQSNEGTNKADQFGLSAPIVVSGPNIAALNKGDVNQNSGNSVDASVRNKARQTNDQSNYLDQHQKVVSRDGSGCQPRCKPECKPRCDTHNGFTRGLSSLGFV
jgi:hypothetical protein